MATGTWVPESERDTSYYIFHKLFMCRVPYLQTMSTDYIKIFGTPISGDLRSDTETVNELVTRMLSIGEMAEFFKDNVTVEVVNYADTKTIYEHISDHLLAWKQKLTNSFHIQNAPIEDLLLLDKFASVVYKHAATILDHTYMNSLLGRRAAGVLMVNRENILTPPKQTITETTEEKRYPERVSMSDSFKLPAGLNSKWH